MKRGYLFASLVIFLLLSTGCMLDFNGFSWADYKYSFKDELHFAASDLESLEIIIRNGKINVVTAENDTDEIVIEVDERIKANDEEAAQEIADKVKLVSDVSGSRLKIEVDYNNDKRLKRRWACKLEVIVPERLALNLRSTNGALTASGIMGRIEAHTTNGSVTVSDCGDDVILGTTNGAIKAEEIDGEVHASTTNGSILVKSDSKIHADTTNGKITAIVLTELNDTIVCSTTNGSISCTLPPNSDFTLDAGTTNGSIHVNYEGDFDFNKRRTSARGKAGSGTYKVDLSTTNGGISVNTRE